MSLVHSELHKIRTTRLWWGLLVGAVLYSLIQAGANAALAGQNPGAGQPASAALDTAEAIRTVYAGSAFQGAYIFAMILGITSMTGEYRYKTITPTFLATPLAFRWVHFGYAIEKGLHTFMEKPLTVDGPSTRKMLALGEKAAQKNLKVGVGLMCRHCDVRGELFKRIQDGEIGDVVRNEGNAFPNCLRGALKLRCAAPYQDDTSAGGVHGFSHRLSDTCAAASNDDDLVFEGKYV